jgi:hypothetical protein
MRRIRQRIRRRRQWFEGRVCQPSRVLGSVVVDDPPLLAVGPAGDDVGRLMPRLRADFQDGPAPRSRSTTIPASGLRLPIVRSGIRVAGRECGAGDDERTPKNSRTQTRRETPARAQLAVCDGLAAGCQSTGPPLSLLFRRCGLLCCCSALLRSGLGLLLVLALSVVALRHDACLV